MKTLLAFFILLLPQLLLAQRVVNLSVNQPPELGFSINRLDTTIMKGESIVLGTDIFVYGGSENYTFKWSPGTALNDSTVRNPLSTPSDTISYSVTVTDKNGCSFSVAYTVNVKTPNTKSNLVFSVQNLYVTLFPNPNKGYFMVNLKGKPTKKIEISVIDINGKVVKNSIIHNFMGEQTEILNLKMERGVYMLKITSKSESLSQQFIIH